MEKNSKHIKARIYIGGLRSLFEDMAGILAEIEKTGSVPNGIVESLNDISEAIDLTRINDGLISFVNKPLVDILEQLRASIEGNEAFLRNIDEIVSKNNYNKNNKKNNSITKKNNDEYLNYLFGFLLINNLSK